MLTLRNNSGNASLASIFAVMAVIGLYVLQDQNKTQHLRAQVLNASLSSLAKQANESALSRTRSLLQKSANGSAAISVQGQSFVASSGSNFQIQQGVLVLDSPDPRSGQWMQGGTAVLNSRVAVEKVELDAANAPKALIAVATTEVTSGSTHQIQKTRARFDLLALNGSGGSSNNPAANPSGSTAIASNSPTPSNNGGPCGGSLSPGNSQASSATGNNSANSTAQGQNTGTSAQTTGNSAAGCSMSQTGGNSASATGSASGPNSTVTTSTTTTPNSASSSSSASAGVP